jgi:mitochondrial fission protein ELM1
VTTGLEHLSAWIITEGYTGMEVQAKALSDALGLSPEIKQVSAPPIWPWLPVSLWPAPLYFARARGAALDPPWPEILITCGRRSAAIAIAIRRESRKDGGPGTFTVHIQNPQVVPRRLDLVITPSHDLTNIRRYHEHGPNIITTLGSLHQLNPEILAAEAAKFRGRFADLPRPLVGVLVGGPSKTYRMGTGSMEVLGAGLRRLTSTTGCGLMVLTSRRTGEANTAALKHALEGTDSYFWDGEGENPYRGLLGLADALVVTCDSVNMVTEAAATGKPVYVAMFESWSKRILAFHKEMRETGHARVFEGAVDFDWKPEPLLETPRIATEIAMRYRSARPARA